MFGQYERWGPIFIPAYLSCSAYLWMRNKDAYRDNPFEVEAYRLADPHRPHPGDDDSTELKRRSKINSDCRGWF